ncbi:MAG: hypothetical protein E3J56_00160 [Candidatus Aminicenantes bacterium]|nr:MAG: hypothetical protein E3J56_00160 [Candidatus Aminicenantes bacterium]
MKKNQIILIIGGILILIGLILNFNYWLQWVKPEEKILNINNFEKANVTLIGKIDSVSEDSIVVDRKDRKFTFQIKEDILIFIPDEETESETLTDERALVKEGELKDLSANQKIEVIANFSNNVFQAIRITVLPSLE